MARRQTELVMRMRPLSIAEAFRVETWMIANYKTREEAKADLHIRRKLGSLLKYGVVKECNQTISAELFEQALGYLHE